VELAEFLEAVRRGWKVLVAFVLTGAVVGGALAALTPEVYQSTSRVFVSVPGATDVRSLTDSSTYATQQAPVFAQLVLSDVVLEDVAAAVGDGTTPGGLRPRVSAAAVEAGPIIEIQARAGSGEEAALVTESTVDALVTAVQQVVGGGPTAPGVELTVIQPAQVPSAPVSPSMSLNVLLGVLVGLVLGLLVVVAMSVRAPARRAAAVR
uniref:YveK family protein n=1 Tax=Cellulomonas endophytica TaxID=2494735 RepID=UPI00196ADEEC